MPMAHLRRRSDKMQLALGVAAGALWASHLLRGDHNYTFRGKTVLITGGSRGPGSGPPRRAARDLRSGF
jgi:hypothetical protein